MSEVAMQANALRKLLEQKIESPDRGWPVKEAKLFLHQLAKAPLAWD